MPRLTVAQTFAGAAVVTLSMALAAPVLEVRATAQGPETLELGLLQAPALWGDLTVGGTLLPTLAALALVVVGVARSGRRHTRLVLTIAAALVQLDLALVRVAAWEILGAGRGVAGTRFGLLLLGAAAGLMLLAAAFEGQGTRHAQGEWGPPARSRLLADLRRRLPRRHARWF